MTSRTWIIFIAIVVVLFGGLIYLSTKDNVDVSNVNGDKVQATSEKSGGIADHVYGVRDSKVVLVEYGDYQCPGCGSAYQPIKEVTEKYKGQLTFIFRNFPLTNIHPNARAAAAAAEAAGKMGKYWEMHDKLFESQSEWQGVSATERTSIFTGYAASLGLNPSKFEAILTDQSTSLNQKINFDIALGRKAGVDSTPTFFLNGKKITEKTDDGNEIWADADQFEQKVLLPAFQQAGIELPNK